MGLLGGSGPSNEAERLIENASHDSVTESRLTELDSSGLTGRKGVKLYDKPLIDYLKDDEQPEYIFYAGGKDIQITHDSTDSVFTIEGNGIYCVTDERVLVIIGREEGDASFGIPLNEIYDFECKSARMKHRISINTESDYIDAKVQPVLDEAGLSIGEVKEAVEERDASLDKVKADVGEDGETLPEGRCKVDLFVVNAFDGEDIDEVDRFLTNAVQRGSAVSAEGGGSELKHYGKVNDYLDDGEIPQHILRGKTLEIEYGGEDDDKWGKSVFTAATNDRVLIVISQRISGNDTRSIQYESIDGVNFEKALVNKELQIRAGGATYKIHVLDQSETKSTMEYIREQMRTSQQPNQIQSSNQTKQADQTNKSESEPDPTEQLKNLKELHDEGVVSDEEFESKKQDLMDKI